MPTKSYHYSDGKNSFGPLTLEELRTKQIGPNTLIWTEDLVTWTKAQDVAELKDLFVNTVPPAIPTPMSGEPTAQHSFTTDRSANTNFLRPPKTYLVESIITTIICCWIFGIPAIVYASRVEKKFYAGDLAGAESDSKNAKKWIIINIVACGLVWLLTLGLFGLGFLTSAF